MHERKSVDRVDLTRLRWFYKIWEERIYKTDCERYREKCKMEKKCTFKMGTLKPKLNQIWK